MAGCMLNTDPSEGLGTHDVPDLGQEYWYPLWEKLVELDVPAYLHSAGLRGTERHNYSLHFINEESVAVMALSRSKVFQAFPSLKIVVSHGGGAIPYHMGRFRAWSVHKKETFFDEQLKRLHFDTTTYDKDALELLFKVVGTERVLFATENPGTGSAIDPRSGRAFDDLKPVIEAMEMLSDKDRENIFECNCTRLYSRFRRD